MLNLIRATSDNEDFKHLIILLDQQLNERNGAIQSSYTRFNVIAAIDTVVIAKFDNHPVGCGCFKQFDKNAVEIKRMFVKPEHRGTGIATRILSELETWAAGLGFSRSVLETGKKQLEAINLYKKSGYAQIENYGPYVGMENSVCFAKKLK